MVTMFRATSLKLGIGSAIAAMTMAGLLGGCSPPKSNCMMDVVQSQAVWCGVVCKLKIVMNPRETMVTLFGLRAGCVLTCAMLLQPQALEIYEMKRADDAARERDT